MPNFLNIDMRIPNFSSFGIALALNTFINFKYLFGHLIHLLHAFSYVMQKRKKNPPDIFLHAFSLRFQRCFVLIACFGHSWNFGQIKKLLFLNTASFLIIPIFKFQVTSCPMLAVFQLQHIKSWVRKKQTPYIENKGLECLLLLLFFIPSATW